VIRIAKLWAGPIICAIFSEPSEAIVEQFKSQALNVDPVFVPPSSDSDHLYVYRVATFRVLQSFVSCHDVFLTRLSCLQISRKSSAAGRFGPLSRCFHVSDSQLVYCSSAAGLDLFLLMYGAAHWFFFAIDVDFVPSATLYASLAANSEWLVSVAPSGSFLYELAIPVFKS
jgi:hypothetical protein